MSNKLECPDCAEIGCDAVWPAPGFGNFVTQHQVDATRGTEDPAQVVQSGEPMYRCRLCGAIWIDGAWHIRAVPR